MIRDKAARHTAERVAHWIEFRRQTWSPDDQQRQRLLLGLRDEERAPLSQVINLMAFGLADVPDGLEVLAAQTWEEAARKQQAALALFDAAKRGSVKLIGSPRKGGDESDLVQPAYFDTPRNLGHEDNTIETDREQIPMDVYEAVREGRHQAWFNVRVDVRSFQRWVVGAYGGGAAKAREKKSLGLFYDRDLPMIKKMHRLRSRGKAQSDWHAATIVAREARHKALKKKGLLPPELRATEQSIAHRFARRYKTMYGAQD